MNIDNLEEIDLKNSELNSAVVDYIESNKESLIENPFLDEGIFGASDPVLDNDYCYIECEYDLITKSESGSQESYDELIEIFDLSAIRKEHIEKEIHIIIFDFHENELGYTANLISRYYGDGSFIKKITQQIEIPKS
jgi:hypothetical protein